MGGYGGYVWSAFGFALVSMGGLLWQSWRAQARRTTELTALRSKLRGAADPGVRRQPRRLVATKPESGTGADTLATPGSASGT